MGEGHPGSEPGEVVESRKAEHLSVTMSQDVTTGSGPGWNQVHLLHEPLPEVDVDEVDLHVPFLGAELAAPLVIAGMTGGHERALELNRVLARAAERHGLAMGVGSQRSGILNDRLADTYSVVRREAPTAFLIGNIGAAQLITQDSGPALTVAEVRSAVDMIKADALAVHLNFVEEVVQSEGDRRARGCLAAIAHLAEEISVPLIGKETGAGMQRSAVKALRDVGVRAVDVGGSGGTSFVVVEGIRAARQGDMARRQLGDTLGDWGIPTAVSVLAAAGSGIPVIATGGVRSGHDAARALALGADLVGVGRPLMQAAHEGASAVDEWIAQFLEELQVISFLSGCNRVTDLRHRPYVLTGMARDWAVQLGYLQM